MRLAYVATALALLVLAPGVAARQLDCDDPVARDVCRPDVPRPPPIPPPLPGPGLPAQPPGIPDVPDVPTPPSPPTVRACNVAPTQYPLGLGRDVLPTPRDMCRAILE